MVGAGQRIGGRRCVGVELVFSDLDSFDLTPPLYLLLCGGSGGMSCLGEFEGG